MLFKPINEKNVNVVIMPFQTLSKQWRLSPPEFDLDFLLWVKIYGLRVTFMDFDLRLGYIRQLDL